MTKNPTAHYVSGKRGCRGRREHSVNVALHYSICTHTITHNITFLYSSKSDSAIYTGWPRKNATLTINDFKKMRDRINNPCSLLLITFFFQQDDTKIINFGEAFGFYGRFSEAMSFSKFATSVSKVTIDVPKISIVCLPRVKCLLLLCKTKTA